MQFEKFFFFLKLYFYIQNRRELRLDRVDAEIRTVWNFYRILESYQDNKDQVRTYSAYFLLPNYFQ